GVPKESGNSFFHLRNGKRRTCPLAVEASEPTKSLTPRAAASSPSIAMRRMGIAASNSRSSHLQRPKYATKSWLEQTRQNGRSSVATHPLRAVSHSHERICSAVPAQVSYSALYFTKALGQSWHVAGYPIHQARRG